MAKETDFFKQTNISLSERHRNKLDDLKKLTVLSNNIYIDNSTFIRAMIDFLHDHPETCVNIKQYIIQNKGATFLTNFDILVEEGKSLKEISEIMGVDIKLIEKIFTN